MDGMNPFGSPIPGETPLNDISGLKIKGINERQELNDYEFRNIARASKKYLLGKPSRRLVPFDLSWLRKLHFEMFGDVWEWAGHYRVSETNIGVNPVQIETQLYTLLEDLKAWQASDVEMLEQCVRLHHRSVQIHPFTNGNGRWARMLGNIWAKMHRQPIVAWPEKVIANTSPERDEYLAAIKEADDGNLAPLIEFHRRFTD
ncbi:MAG: mobile mystery protein B [Planctomycetes bacterium]|nr:mobile mystery protein B [Planctomycetota bacterium]